jgi:hypothetical protein
LHHPVSSDEKWLLFALQRKLAAYFQITEFIFRYWVSRTTAINSCERSFLNGVLDG